MTDDLTRAVRTLEAQLPQLIADIPDPPDFWPAFAGEADAIEDSAGERVAEVQERIQKMPAVHGRYIATV